MTLALTLFGHPDTALLRGTGVTIAALCGIAVLGAVQLLPMSQGTLARVSSQSADVYRDAESVLKIFGRSAPAARISIAPAETMATMLLTLAYGALFVSSVLLLGSRRRRRIAAGVLLAAIGIHILVATIARAIDSGNEDRLHGAFVNPNHFAGYLMIALALAFGVLWREILHMRDAAPHLARSVRFERRFLRLSAATLLWGVFAAAIGLTKSRGGILAAVLMMALLIVCGLLHPRLRKERWAYSVLILGALAAGAGFVVLAVRQQPILRFLASDPRDPASDLRIRLWQVSIDAWRQFPLFGSGLGTFREAFRPVQPRDLEYLVEFAHSDSLQLLVTGGAIGLMLAAIAIATLGIRLARAWHRQRRREESAFALAGLGALFALTLHGLVEFNFSIPAIPATLAAVLGLSWAATHGESS